MKLLPLLIIELTFVLVLQGTDAFPCYNSIRQTSFPRRVGRMNNYVSSSSRAAKEVKTFSQNGLGENRTANLGRRTIFWLRCKQIWFHWTQLWWNIQKLIRSRVEKFTVYVLECEDGKFYVGSTSHRKQRFRV